MHYRILCSCLYSTCSKFINSLILGLPLGAGCCWHGGSFLCFSLALTFCQVVVRSILLSAPDSSRSLYHTPSLSLINTNCTTAIAKGLLQRVHHANQPISLPLPSRMHAGVRRVPAERARHAKRLGHVQQGPGFFPVVVGPSSGSAMTTTTTTATTAPTPSTIQSSSRALTSSSTTPSSSSAPSSVTTPSPSSVPFSPTTLSLPISPLTTYPAESVPTSPTSSPSPPASVNAVTSSGLSGGAIAGIIAGAVIVGAALIVFFVRKTYLRRRERKHMEWNGPSGLGGRVLDEPKPLPDISEPPLSSPQRNAPLSPFDAYGQSMYSTPVMHTQPPSIPAYPVPTPPPVTYNNPAPVAAYHTRLAPSTYNPGNTTAPAVARVAAGTGISSTLPPVRAQHAPLEAIVKCTFVPTLPDELSITTGERIFVVEQYDDGWDLCANVRGERGMVPRECLEHAPIGQPDIGWRNAGRTSSLNPDGKRF